jgi:UDP-N-acetylmuramoyl-tripeptide--D-alanyl-D-alanine ligase
MKDNYRIKLDFNISNFIRIIDGTVNSAIKENKCVLSLDTRNLQQGDLFLAIKGNYSDGHIYIDQAFKEGASAAIISNIELFKRSDSPLIYVEDTYDALCKIAKYIRVRSKALRIAITGSF